MRLKLNETEDELKQDKAELGLSNDSAQRENVYGIELPIKREIYILISILRNKINDYILIGIGIV